MYESNVILKLTLGAFQPFQLQYLETQRHHLSPAFKPGKLYRGIGDIRLFQWIQKNSKTK